MPPAAQHALTAFTLKALDDEYLHVLGGVPARPHAFAAAANNTRTSTLRRAAAQSDSPTAYSSHHYHGGGTPRDSDRRGGVGVGLGGGSRHQDPMRGASSTTRPQSHGAGGTVAGHSRGGVASSPPPRGGMGMPYNDGAESTFRPQTTSIAQVMRLRAPSSNSGLGRGQRSVNSRSVVDVTPPSYQRRHASATRTVRTPVGGSTTARRGGGGGGGATSGPGTRRGGHSAAYFDYDEEQRMREEEAAADRRANRSPSEVGSVASRRSKGNHSVSASSKSILKKRAAGGAVSAASSVSSAGGGGIRPSTAKAPNNSNSNRRMSLVSEVDSVDDGGASVMTGGVEGPLVGGGGGAAPSRVPLTSATLAAASAAAAAASLGGAGGGGLHRTGSVRSNRSRQTAGSASNRGGEGGVARARGASSKRRNTAIAALLAGSAADPSSVAGRRELAEMLPLAAHFHSLEEYLSEPVVDRLLGPRRINSATTQVNVASYKTQKAAQTPFKPTLNAKSIELDASSPTLRMAYAKQRRKDTMLSPPRTSRLRRTNSTVSSVWGADSEILKGISAIRPPSEAGGGRGKGGRPETKPLALTPKARRMQRTVDDLFAWQAQKEEAAEERAVKDEERRGRAQAEEDKEIFAIREQEYAIALAKYMARRAKKAAKRRKVVDYLQMAGGGAGTDVDSDAKSDVSERFRALHAPSHVTAESERLVLGMGDRRIDVYDHAQMTAQAKGQEAIERRMAREAERNRWADEESRRLEQLREQRSYRRREQSYHRQRCGGAQQDDFVWFQAQLMADPAYH